LRRKAKENLRSHIVIEGRERQEEYKPMSSYKIYEAEDSLDNKLWHHNLVYPRCWIIWI